MDSKQQILSYIQRTNSLLKSNYIKTSDSDSKLPVVALTPRSTKKVKKIQSKPLSQTQARAQTTHPKASKASQHSQDSNKSSRKNSPAPQDTLDKSSLEFKKKVYSTLDELLQTKGLKHKKNLELSLKEETSIKYLKGLIENQKKNVKQIDNEKQKLKGKKNNYANAEKYQKLIQDITKESAEDLLLIENKCREIEENNYQLKLSLEVKENHPETVKPEKKAPKLENVKLVIESILKDHEEEKDENFMILNSRITADDYGKAINELCDKWSSTIEWENNKIIGCLAFSIEKEKNAQKTIQENLKETQENNKIILDQLQEKLDGLINEG